MAQIGVDPAAARRVDDAASAFRLPKGASPAELRALPEAEWMARHGDVLASERYFEARDPGWATRPDGWWARAAGRAGPGGPPLWLRAEYHFPELDAPAGRDRAPGGAPPASRPARPLWAERLGLAGPRPAPAAATIYGHRAEYRPSHKGAARSAFERYQPAYSRVLAGELPDVADPPDGRFWAAGVAQGGATHPYEPRLASSGRRKPISLGPRSISAVVDGETHTLAAAVVDAAWLLPETELAGYCTEHPVYRHVNLRVQTKEGSGVSGEAALARALEAAQGLFLAAGDAMGEAMAAWPARAAAAAAEAEAAAAAAADREAKMAAWLAQTVDKAAPWDRALEVELFGKVISHDLAAEAEAAAAGGKKKKRKG